MGQRHYGLDWLRIGAFGLLIFYHVGMFFVHWNWHVKTARPLDWVAVPMLALSAWRLSLLFLVSGYASRVLFAKSGGVGAFARNRSARLLIPLLFAMIFLIAPQPWVELRFKHDYPHGFAWFYANDYFDFRMIEGLAVPTWQHLWFVVYLWVYTILLALVAAAMPVRIAERLGGMLDRLLSSWRVLVLPLLWIALCQAVLFRGRGHTHGLFDDPQAHVIFLPMFLFGFLLADAPGIWAAIRRWWRVALVMGLSGYMVVAGVELSYPGTDRPPPGVMFAYHLGHSVQAWGTIVALIGAADRFLNHDWPGRAMLTEAVFPFYIIHQTIIVLVGWWLLPFRLHPLAEFLIMVAVTAAGCWLFYDVGRRIPWLRPLIGLRAKPAQSSARSVTSP